MEPFFHGLFSKTTTGSGFWEANFFGSGKILDLVRFFGGHCHFLSGYTAQFSCVLNRKAKVFVKTTLLSWHPPNQRVKFSWIHGLKILLNVISLHVIAFLEMRKSNQNHFILTLELLRLFQNYARYDNI